ncbi:F-box protein 21 [Podila epicladia]|nr:F-box protein 21 [Podila epicladia]
MSKGKGKKEDPSLPEDCIFEIFQYLSAEDLAHASMTCRSWKKLSEKNSLWQQLCLERWRTWPTPSPLPPSEELQQHHPTLQEQLRYTTGNVTISGIEIDLSSTAHTHYEHMVDVLSDPSPSRKRPTRRPSYPPARIEDLHRPRDWYSASEPPFEMDSWKKVYRERHEKDAIVRELLQEMVQDSRSRMRHMEGIADLGMVMARDVLENIIAGRDGEEKDLSRSYYARKTVARLQRGWVLDQWRGFRENEIQFPIWQGCGLISMYSNQGLDLADLDRQFQALADEFLRFSPVDQDEHESVLTVSETAATFVGARTFDRYSPGSISIAEAQPESSTESHESSSEQIAERYRRHYERQTERLRDLVRFFTVEQGFKGNVESYYDPFNSFIDKVLSRKVGIPLSLCVVFAELALRVGLSGVELMGMPQHFMIRYRPTVPAHLGHVAGSGSGLRSTPPPPTPPTYYLDLFHAPHRLISMDEYDDYFVGLSIQRPSNIYRDLPVPPVEVYLRCLRNIILAVDHSGGALRFGSDHHNSLYSAMSQLLVLSPNEENWTFYDLWLQYLTTFWPEDVGFARTAIHEMDESDQRRMLARGYGPKSAPPVGQRTHHVFGIARGGHGPERLHPLHQGSRNPARQQTVRILRSAVQKLDIEDDTGDVGFIRRRRRPRVTQERKSTSEQDLGSDSPVPAEPQVSSSPNSPFGRDRQRPEPEYYVGEVFRHKSYRYLGAIYGYDLKCEQPENWIQSMGIDSLKYGRNQPFYNAILADGAQRYVAQENVQVMFRRKQETPPTVQFSSNGESSSSSVSTSGAGAGAGARTGTSSDSDVPNVSFSVTWIERDPLTGNSIIRRDTHTTDLSTSEPVQSFTHVHVPSSSTNDTTVEHVVADDGDEANQEEEEEATLDETLELSLISLEEPFATTTTPPGTTTTSISAATVEATELGPLGIEDIGKFFESWYTDGEEGHYVMNKEIRRLYPTEDYDY